jgi:hypothetical protein
LTQKTSFHIKSEHFVAVAQVLSVAWRNASRQNLFSQLALPIADADFPAALPGTRSF